MVNRLEIAKQYVQEMLEKRDDIVGAFVVGSVARGDVTQGSDIDLVLVVEGGDEAGLAGRGMDAWRDGVYIDAEVQSAESLSSVGQVLSDLFAASYLNEALILYDPSGQFASLQEEVRAAFSKPDWLRDRVQSQLKMLHGATKDLRDAVAAGDPYGICWYENWVSLLASTIPLVSLGVTPGSKALAQLDQVSPELKRRISEWEGSESLCADEVLDVATIVHACVAQIAATDPDQWGHRPEYTAQKAETMARGGAHREAVQLMWRVVGGLAYLELEGKEAPTGSETEKLVRSWLRSVGWEGQEVLEEKVRMAEEMVEEVAAMAAHLPSDEG